MTTSSPTLEEYIANELHLFFLPDCHRQPLSMVRAFAIFTVGAVPDINLRDRMHTSLIWVSFACLALFNCWDAKVMNWLYWISPNVSMCRSSRACWIPLRGNSGNSWERKPVARLWGAEQDKGAECLALHYVALDRSCVLCSFTPVFICAGVRESRSSQVQPCQGESLLSSAGVGESGFVALWHVEAVLRIEPLFISMPLKC